MIEYVAQPMSNWFVWVFGTGAISTGVLLLLFAQLTMRRIEKQIKSDNALSYQPLDFGGSRIITYAYAIVFPEHIALRIARLIDVRLIRSYAHKADWVLGLLFIITSHLWIITTLLVAVLSTT